MEPRAEQGVHPRFPLTASRSSAAAYEELAYPGYAYPWTHPAHLQVIGRLFNLEPAPASGSRVLELGCGDGGNALAIAHTLPGATVLGLDAAGAAVARGRALAEEAGLANVELRVADLVDPAAVEGQFDYIIAHGVYSWIPPAARHGLLACCRRCLAPQGIAFVSYNAYPGSYLRDMARDVLAFHLRGRERPEDRLAGAHELMEMIVAAETPSPYARVLREHLQRMLASGDALLYHDDLAPISTPFYFHEFMEHATAHELQFLSEASLVDSQLRAVPDQVARFIAGLPDEPLLREQYLDFFTNRMFRQTLLVRSGTPMRREIDDDRLTELVIASPAHWDGGRFLAPNGVGMTSDEGTVVAAMHELCDRWPEGVPFAELLTRVADRVAPGALTRVADRVAPGALARAAVDRLRAVLLHAYLGQLVHLYGCAPPVTARAGERPVTGALARAQCRIGKRVLTTQLGTNWALETDLQQALIPLLDGQRTASELAREVGAEAEEVEEVLAELAKRGLLSG